MPYRFRINGIDVECQTADELQAAMKIKGFKEGASHGGSRTAMDSDGRKGQGDGPRKSWEEADAYAKKHGITRNEARIRIAAEKKRLIEQALKKRKV